MDGKVFIDFSTRERIGNARSGTREWHRMGCSAKVSQIEFLCRLCGGVRCVTPPQDEQVSHANPRYNVFSAGRVWDTLAIIRIITRICVFLFRGGGRGLIVGGMIGNIVCAVLVPIPVFDSYPTIGSHACERVSSIPLHLSFWLQCPQSSFL